MKKKRTERKHVFPPRRFSPTRPAFTRVRPSDFRPSRARFNYRYIHIYTILHLALDPDNHLAVTQRPNEQIFFFFLNTENKSTERIKGEKGDEVRLRRVRDSFHGDLFRGDGSARERGKERITGVRDVTSKSTGAELRFATSGPETIRPMRRAAVPLASGPKTDRNLRPRSASNLLLDPSMDPSLPRSSLPSRFRFNFRTFIPS